ncbi:hypothetical protein GCM10007424_12350 [Flavobacterium suaedae]|uniref:Secretion system C-terminal sorting domain-containing protein n=2 Tax=Flavobacterium suaedae TaxID=1767027 RepID=A0ABQ1JT32_9FLAO|nr:hypothetical protein GCM10007424_12350 [Flavobacterium suaedae]
MLLGLSLFVALQSYGQVEGCTDPLAINYNAEATENDGSCMYENETVSPESSVVLPDELTETSGLIVIDDRVLTHNDNTDTNLYEVNSETGVVEEVYPIPGVTNIDWEEITQDEDNIYIGDFGNNANGNRTDLKILKVNKADLFNNEAQVEIINFSYSDQTDFTPTGGNNTDFDCEAFIAFEDNIYLFTKQWQSKETSVYMLPKIPGTYSAELQDTHSVEGLITGATYLEDKKLVVLSGYDSSFLPFFYLLYDYDENDFFTGNKRKIQVSTSFHQVEGIATSNGTDYYLSNERIQHPTLGTIPQKLHYYDLSVYLENYLQGTAGTESFKANNVKVYPNPATGTITVTMPEHIQNTGYTIYDMTGRVILKDTFSKTTSIDISVLQPATYIIKVDSKNSKPLVIIKE